jgi:hypothetical protein
MRRRRGGRGNPCHQEQGKRPPVQRLHTKPPDQPAGKRRGEREGWGRRAADQLDQQGRMRHAGEIARHCWQDTPDSEQADRNENGRKGQGCPAPKGKLLPIVVPAFRNPVQRPILHLSLPLVAHRHVAAAIVAGRLNAPAALHKPAEDRSHG